MRLFGINVCMSTVSTMCLVSHRRSMLSPTTGQALYTVHFGCEGVYCAIRSERSSAHTRQSLTLCFRGHHAMAGHTVCSPVLAGGVHRAVSAHLRACAIA